MTSDIPETSAPPSQSTPLDPTNATTVAGTTLATDTEPRGDATRSSNPGSSGAQTTSDEALVTTDSALTTNDSAVDSAPNTLSSSEILVTSPSCGRSNIAPGDETRSVVVASMSRTFVVHVPPSYDGSTPLPVVIDFHPLGGTGSSWRGSTGWQEVADREGFILVWPDGVGNSWNVGRCCSTARAEEVDDVAFTRAIIEQLSVEGCIDSKRVYATGCSNGGGMAYRVACEAADVVAAVAPVDFDCVFGPDDAPSCGSCNPSRPIAEIQFRGTNDTAVPYTGGPGPRREVVFPGAATNFADWATINQCTGNPVPLSENAACTTHAGCKDDVETTLCTVQNGAHCSSYASFGIAALAWQRLTQARLP